jgi:hypothetical protein
MADNARRETAVVAVTLALATVFIVLMAWFLVEVLVGPDPRDPLTKAGGLKPEQDIRRAK